MIDMNVLSDKEDLENDREGLRIFQKDINDRFHGNISEICADIINELMDERKINKTELEGIHKFTNKLLTKI